MQKRFKNLFRFKSNVYDSLGYKLSRNNSVISKILNFVMNFSYYVLRRIKRIVTKLKKNNNIKKHSSIEPEYIKLFNHQSSCFKNNYSLADLMPYISSKENKYKIDYSSRVTVIIPIYNGYNHLRNLFNTLFKNTSSCVRFIIVDDCSTDERVAILLKSIENNPNINVIHNKTNCGFVKSINLAMNMVLTEFAILLNSDTEVPRNWVNKLLHYFETDEKIATVTPFTNSGVLFSFPNFLQNNSINFDIEKINQAFSYINPNTLLRNYVPSGTGYCMAIRTVCWKIVGPFDYESFEKGYGEENDWCFKILEKGWRHVLAPTLFVKHFHGGSFDSLEKQKLMKPHSDILAAKYPLLTNSIVPNFCSIDPFRVYRQVALLHFYSKNVKLVIDLEPISSDKSGAIDFSASTFKSTYDKQILLIKYDRFGNGWKLYFDVASDPLGLNCITLKNFYEIICLFERFNISEIIVNNLAFYNDVYNLSSYLINLKSCYDFKLEFLVHDYFCVCPSMFLLDSNCFPCQYVDKNICNKCLKSNSLAAVGETKINIWRNNFLNLLCVCDSITVFSNDSKKIISSVYPSISSKINVVYHKPLMPKSFSKYCGPFVAQQKIPTIGFVGNFCKIKGGALFNQLKQIYKNKGIKANFVIIGSDDSTVFTDIKTTGKYNRFDLGSILTKEKVDLVVFPSVARETFSYTIQELMFLNIPIVVFPIGAPQERILKLKYKNGCVTKNVSSADLFECSFKMLKKIGYYSE